VTGRLIEINGSWRDYLYRVRVDDDLLHYFAYGSNLHPARMRLRVPSARQLGCAVLTGHVLRFHKQSIKDGSAKCDAHYTGRSQDRVYGAVYSLAPEEKAALDTIEGPGYEIAERVVIHDGNHQAVFLYRARPEAIAADLQPYDWYHALVVAGARHHGLPPTYVDSLAAVPTRNDPDTHRANRELAPLQGSL
jgi:gamma-glutamylcyclotransferase (GGCT)/AIG2-like uncharacterized protein YtfP